MTQMFELAQRFDDDLNTWDTGKSDSVSFLVKMAQNLDLRCVLVPAPCLDSRCGFAIGSQHLGCWGQNTSRIREFAQH